MLFQTKCFITQLFVVIITIVHLVKVDKCYNGLKMKQIQIIHYLNVEHKVNVIQPQIIQEHMVFQIVQYKFVSLMKLKQL